MVANGLVTLLLVGVVAVAITTLVRRFLAADPDDTSFEHWMLDVGGMRPIPPIHALVREAIGPWQLEPRQAAIGQTVTAGRVLAVETARGWSLLIERPGPAPERIDGRKVQVGSHGWLALHLSRAEHLGAADEAMTVLWDAARPWIRGPGQAPSIS